MIFLWFGIKGNLNVFNFLDWSRKLSFKFRNFCLQKSCVLFLSNWRYFRYGVYLLINDRLSNYTRIQTEIVLLFLFNFFLMLIILNWLFCMNLGVFLFLSNFLMLGFPFFYLIFINLFICYWALWLVLSLIILLSSPSIWRVLRQFKMLYGRFI